MCAYNFATFVIHRNLQRWVNITCMYEHAAHVGDDDNIDNEDEDDHNYDKDNTSNNMVDSWEEAVRWASPNGEGAKCDIDQISTSLE